MYVDFRIRTKRKKHHYLFVLFYILLAASYIKVESISLFIIRYVNIITYHTFNEYLQDKSSGSEIHSF